MTLIPYDSLRGLHIVYFKCDVIQADETGLRWR
jgi:hypothetical protein